MKKEKYLLNPHAPDAFSPDVMHKVVLNGIDFGLPDHIWDAINDAFEYYWNVEVGLGGWADFDSATDSISNQLLKDNIIYPFDKLVTIVGIMFDWIEQIPGALLDEEEVEDPHENPFFFEIKKKFTPNVMRNVVLRSLDFEFPDHIWNAIDDAFANYWNVEVGLGGWADLDSATDSISNRLLKDNIIYPIDKIATIVGIMFDWIEQIPGALVDDEEVEAPFNNSCGDENNEEERLLFEKIMQEEEECDF